MPSLWMPDPTSPTLLRPLNYRGVRFYGSTSGRVGLKAPAIAGSVDYTLPGADGANGQVLKTNASGVLSFGDVAAANVTGLAAVATSGAYSSLSGLPTLGTLAALNAAPAGTLTGTVLAANVVTSSLTALGTIGTGVWQGTKVNLAYGGTNADLSATGGTSQVLKQISAGDAITVGQLASSDLSNAANIPLLNAANSFSLAQTHSQALAAVTSADGFVLSSTTIATVGNQAYSPRIRWHGSGWKTNATAAAQDVDVYLELRPLQSTSAPRPQMFYRYATNGGAYTDLMSFGLNVNALPFIQLGGNGVYGASGTLTIQAASSVTAGLGTNSAFIVSGGTGVWRINPDLGTMTMGGTTSSFPLVKRNGTAINFRLADDSADCAITAAAATFSGDVVVPTKTPADAGAAGVTGNIAWDSSYVYVCTATNTWKRVAIATW